MIASSYNPNENVTSLLAYCFELKGRTEIHRGVLYAVFIALKEYVPFISLLVLLKKKLLSRKRFRNNTKQNINQNDGKKQNRDIKLTSLLVRKHKMKVIISQRKKSHKQFLWKAE